MKPCSTLRHGGLADGLDSHLPAPERPLISVWQRREEREPKELKTEFAPTSWSWNAQPKRVVWISASELGEIWRTRVGLDRFALGWVVAWGLLLPNRVARRLRSVS